MNTNLAIFTAQLGTVSETFIRLHVECLLPGRTVAIARRFSHPMGGRWEPSCPTLFLDRWAQGLHVRLAQRMGLHMEDLRAFTVGRFLKRHNVGIVLGEYLDQFVDFVPVLDHLAMPYIVQGHGIDLSASLRESEMAQRYQSYRSARAILTRCEFHRQRLIGIGLPSDLIHVNPGGIEVPATVPRRGSEAWKRFLAIGRMVPKKGPIYLLEAFRLAAERNREIFLDYIGDGELLPAARQFVEACRLGERVRLHEAASEETKHRLFAECGVFVQHSITDPATGDEEGLPASIQEAMMHGMPVVSTRHSGIPDAVEEGRTGLLVSEGDTNAMAEAMLRLAATNGLGEKLGGAGRVKAESCYSWDAERTRLPQFLFGA